MLLIWTCVTYFFLYFPSYVFSDTISSELLETDLSLSCSSVNSSDCYPRIFQPTLHFQKIKEGQELPPGLHIRMNIYTGEKEARLNVPMTDEDDTIYDVQSLPTETALITLEEENTHQKPSKDQEEPIKPVASEDKIPFPLSGSELHTFQASISILKSRGSLFDQALEDLSELAHDIYYGREIAREDSLLELLVCLTLGLELENTPKRQINRERKAAHILSSAFQNNPAALKEINSLQRKIMYPSCSSYMENPQKEKENFISIFRSKLEEEKDPNTLKSKIIVLSRFLKSHPFRDLFLQNEGMELLLAVFLKKGEDFNVVRKKIGELLMDNFLDESFGAQFNVWPKTHRSGRSFCEKHENVLQDGCWEHHIEEFSAQSPTEDWPKELLLAIKSQRPQQTFMKSEI